MSQRILPIEHARGLLLIVGLATVALVRIAAAADSTTNDTAGSATPRSDAVQFNRDIRPLLSDNCFQCHGPDPAQRQADLRLDVEASAKRDVDGVHPVVPGDLAASVLYRRLASEDDAERMPPADSGKHLTDEQIELIGRWIRQGANWEPHWAFIPPVRPALPPIRTRRTRRKPHRLVRAGTARIRRPGAAAASRQNDAAAARDARPDRLAADARGDRRFSGRRSRPALTSAWSIGCWRRPATASGWRPAGSTRPAMPTPMAIRTTASATCGDGAIG